MKYTIKAVGDPREWSNDHGRFYAYPLDLKDEQGNLNMGIEWSRKVDSKAPEVGDELIGKIQGGQHGEKIKIDWDAMNGKGGSGGGGSSNGSGSNGGGTWKPRPPEEIAGARHAHNLTVAAASLTPLPADAGPDAVEKRIQQLAYIAEKLDEQTALISTEAALKGNTAPAEQPAAEPAAVAPSSGEQSSDDVPF